MDLLEDCELCYPFTLSEFPETIVIEGGLNPAIQYYFKVTDKFQNSFITEQITPNVDGDVILQVVAGVPVPPSSFTGTLPAAWFNKNAGKFYIEASLTTDEWIPVNLTFNAETYQCIVVEFVNDDSEKNTIL